MVRVELLSRTENRTLVMCKHSTLYAACAVCVTIFSTGGKFRPVSIFTYLILVARSYALLSSVILVKKKSSK